MTILDIDTLSLVCGGQNAPSAQQLTQRSQECRQLLDSLAAGNQHVPRGFGQACGELYPNIQEGRRVVRNMGQQLETR